MVSPRQGCLRFPFQGFGAGKLGARRISSFSEGRSGAEWGANMLINIALSTVVTISMHKRLRRSALRVHEPPARAPFPTPAGYVNP